MQEAGVTDPEQRLAVKIECRARGLVLDRSEADRLLRQLGIDGPVSLEALEERMDRKGYMPSLKTVIKSELQSRGWLRSKPRQN
jgi:hypothetical protein